MLMLLCTWELEDETRENLNKAEVIFKRDFIIAVFEEGKLYSARAATSIHGIVFFLFVLMFQICKGKKKCPPFNYIKPDM